MRICSLVVDMNNANEASLYCRRLESVVRTAEAHERTKAALEHALDDVRGLALPRREEADHFLREEEQEQSSKWMSECQRIAQNAINLVSQATRALTISD
jgi:C4-dicarboxylate-specific signal transduction histidine kinase